MTRGQLETLLAAVVLTGSIAFAYSMGKSNGENRIRVAWQQEELAYNKQINDLRDNYEQLQDLHTQENKAIADQLKQEREQYEEAVNTIRSDYTSRLRDSEERSDIYKRHSQGSAAERERLASHAAKLDRTLEEGRRLVAELTGTVRLREYELIKLGQQIKNDRTLLSE